jgi:hypothetical protein
LLTKDTVFVKKKIERGWIITAEKRGSFNESSLPNLSHQTKDFLQAKRGWGCPKRRRIQIHLTRKCVSRLVKKEEWSVKVVERIRG